MEHGDLWSFYIKSVDHASAKMLPGKPHQNFSFSLFGAILHLLRINNKIRRVCVCVCVCVCV